MELMILRLRHLCNCLVFVVLTALHCSASRGHSDCLETLIALCGAEVDLTDANGCTALFYAVTLGHVTLKTVSRSHENSR